MRRSLLIAAFLSLIVSPSHAWNEDAQACYERHLDVDQVLEACNEALSSPSLNNAERANTFYNRAVIMTEMGDHAAAIADFTEAIRLDPNHVEAHAGRGNAYRQHGRYQEAIADLNAVVQGNPYHPDVYYYLGWIYDELGDYDRAITEFSKAIHLQPDQADNYHDRGVSYLNRGEPDLAIADFTETLRLQPDHVKGLLNRARAYEQQDRTAEARQDYQSALAVAPGQAQAAEALSRLRPGTVDSKGAQETQVAAAPSRAAEVQDFGQLIRDLVKPGAASASDQSPAAPDSVTPGVTAQDTTVVTAQRETTAATAQRETTAATAQRETTAATAQRETAAATAQGTTQATNNPPREIAAVQEPVRLTPNGRPPQVEGAAADVLAAKATRELSVLRDQASVLGERRLALVIGNGSYTSNPLPNPPNDAGDVAAALEEVGFDVTLVLESDRDGMLRAITDFGRAIKNGGVGLFYYAGHAIQVGGSNYLVPIGADLDSEEYVPIEAVDVNQILARMDAASNRLNIVILDACRDNPFARSFRSATRGLAQTSAPSGTFLAYATAPGDVAADGYGRNSPYTEALLAALDERGRKLEEVFKRVRAEVKEKTDGQQTPWTGSSITGDFYFRPPETANGAPSANYRSRDLVAWQAIKSSNQPLDFRTFIEAYPESALTPFARNRLRALGGG